MKVKFQEESGFLREVHLREIPCSLEIKDKGAVRETLKFRFLTPDNTPDGHWRFEKDIVPFVIRIWKKAEGEERRRCEGLLRMIKFHNLFPPHEQMRGQRRFYVDFSRSRGGETERTWYEIARDKGMRDAMDFIMYVTSKDTVPPSYDELLQKAIHREPKLRIPFSRESYYRYREFYLKFWEAYDHQVIRVGAERMFRGKKDSLLEEMRRKNRKRYEKARRSLEESEAFIAREILKEELKNQEKVAQRYGPILEKALDLYRKYRKSAQKGEPDLAQSTFASEFDSLLEDHIVECKADDKHEQVMGVKGDEVRVETKENYIDFLRNILASKDLMRKWEELIKLLDNLTHKSSAIKLMQREAEGVCLGLVSYAINEIYRKIRGNLTVPEKRAFLLAHYRQYKTLGRRSPVFPFGGRIPRLDPVIWDFFRETGETTGALIYSVLVFKYPASANQRRVLAEELRQRWSRYLLFYPHWEGISRWDDRERKHKHEWRKRTIPFETPLGEDEEGNILTLEDTVAEEDVVYPPEVSEKLGSEKLRNEAYRLIEKFCTPRQAEILKLWLDGYSQQEIAEILGKKEGRTLTQQAISKAIREARKKIVEGESGTR